MLDKDICAEIVDATMKAFAISWMELEVNRKSPRNLRDLFKARIKRIDRLAKGTWDLLHPKEHIEMEDLHFKEVHKPIHAVEVTSPQTTIIWRYDESCDDWTWALEKARAQAA